jgi:hypothetical protein
MTRALGVEHRALATAIKPYPCCRFAHGAIDLAIEASNSGVAAGTVRSADIRIYSTGVLGYHQRPRSAVDAQFNLPYVVALALSRGRIALSDFTDEAIRDGEVLALCERIRVREDLQLSARYPEEYGVELDLELDGGEHRTSFSDCPSGDPAAARYRGRPELLWQEVGQKVAALLTEVGLGDRVAGLEAAVEMLPQAPRLDRLSAMLAGEAAAGTPRPGQQAPDSPSFGSARGARTEGATG